VIRVKNQSAQTQLKKHLEAETNLVDIKISVSNVNAGPASLEQASKQVLSILDMDAKGQTREFVDY